MMEQVVKTLQSVVSQPLQLDSTNFEALERGLRHFCGKALVNSVNGDPKVLEQVLPIVKKYGAAVIGLCTDREGVPETAQARLDIARRIVEAAGRHGIPKEDVVIDCLALTVSAQQAQAMETLDALELVKQELGVRTILGVSNISFGLPARDQLNSTFLAMALARGLDLAILNPNSAGMTAVFRAAAVLQGKDIGAARYIEAYGGQTAAPAPGAPAGPASLEDLVQKGLRREARDAIRALLEQGEAPMDIIEQRLIPALDRVGTLFEQGRFFLPQLLNAAETAQAAFSVLQTRLAAQGQSGRSAGRLMVATVQGDIHDIGKNITKCILENYGFQVLDLGRDVPIETVAETAAREKIRLVGLSALMTTTLPSMEKTIRALRRAAPDCRIFAAGAVLTPDYAREIGADYYAKDAKQAVDIAKLVLEQKK